MPKFRLPLGKKKGDQPKSQDAYGQHVSDLIDLSVVLSVAVKKIFFDRSETKFSSDLIIKKKMITQFGNRMRVDAMEKFNQTTVFSIVHFYRDAKAYEDDKPLGLIIVYIERKFVPEMLRLLQYPYIEYDDDVEVCDGAGAIANLIAGQFKKEITKLKYQDLEMSPFRSYINKVPNGAKFPLNETEKYEISFDLEEVRRLVVELVMAPLPRQS